MRWVKVHPRLGKNRKRHIFSVEDAVNIRIISAKSSVPAAGLAKPPKFVHIIGLKPTNFFVTFCHLIVTFYRRVSKCGFGCEARIVGRYSVWKLDRFRYRFYTEHLASLRASKPQTGFETVKIIIRPLCFA